MALSRDYLAKLFQYLETGDGHRFFDHVADNVDWIVNGSHPLAGHCRTKKDFREHTFARLGKVLPHGVQLHVQNILISGDWAVLEPRSMATAKNGLRFDNYYCSVRRFFGDSIVEVRAYLDSALVKQLFDGNPL